MEWIAIAAVAGAAILFGFILQVVKLGLAHEEKRMALKADVGDAARLEQIIAANQAEMEKLRQRVEVLERLATDDERRLSREISGLGNERTPAR